MGLNSSDTVSVSLLDLVVVGVVLGLGHSVVSKRCRRWKVRLEI